MRLRFGPRTGRPPYRIVLILVGALLCSAPGTNWANDDAGDATFAPVTASDILERFCGSLKATDGFQVNVRTFADETTQDGRLLQFESLQTIAVKAPLHLRVETQDDLKHRILWKDEQKVTIFDVEQNLYAEFAFEGTIDEMVDVLAEKYDTPTPLADLLSVETCGKFRDKITDDSYMGVAFVDNEACHHLAIQAESADAQVWLSSGEVTLPRKLQITYRDEPLRPQYLALFDDFEPLEGEAVFNVELPPDAMRIEFAQTNTGGGE